MTTSTFIMVHHFPNSTLHDLAFDSPQGYVLYWRACKFFHLPPDFYQAMSDNCSKDSYFLSVYAKIHGLFLQCGFVNQRSHSLLIFSHPETHCYHQVITPWLKGICSLSTTSPQNAELRTTSCNNLWLGIKREKYAGGNLLIGAKWE